MLQSKLFTKTLRSAPKDEVSVNAQLLIRAGFVDKLTAGVYTYLPLGLRALNKIKDIIREEMDATGGQEILMPALTPRDLWDKTGRWESIDVLFKLVGAGEKEYALGSTHEEIVTPLVQKFASSYKDLPCAVYQIQDKFRNEHRAKSGLLRGREFSMKDLYSFHRDEADLLAYYEKMKEVYTRVFQRCGLNAEVVEASGGVFSQFSHEFQVLTEYGEDDVYFCPECGRHQNKELVSDGELKCPYCGAIREVKKAIEVGNIFPLKTKFSDAFGYKFTDEDGKQKPVLMGCYGIGPSRVLGAVVEVHHDERGIKWPQAIAPFDVHLISLGKDNEVATIARKLYNDLTTRGVAVLWDDRDAPAGEKFADADLIGLPKRVVVSEKTIEKASVEVKTRADDQPVLIKIKEIEEKGI